MSIEMLRVSKKEIEVESHSALFYLLQKGTTEKQQQFKGVLAMSRAGPFGKKGW